MNTLQTQSEMPHDKYTPPSMFEQSDLQNSKVEEDSQEPMIMRSSISSKNTSQLKKDKIGLSVSQVHEFEQPGANYKYSNPYLSKNDSVLSQKAEEFKRRSRVSHMTGSRMTGEGSEYFSTSGGRDTRFDTQFTDMDDYEDFSKFGDEEGQEKDPFAEFADLEVGGSNSKKNPEQEIIAERSLESSARKEDKVEVESQPETETASFGDRLEGEEEIIMNSSSSDEAEEEMIMNSSGEEDYEPDMPTETRKKAKSWVEDVSSEEQNLDEDKEMIPRQGFSTQKTEVPKQPVMEKVIPKRSTNLSRMSRASKRGRGETAFESFDEENSDREDEFAEFEDFEDQQVGGKDDPFKDFE